MADLLASVASAEVKEVVVDGKVTVPAKPAVYEVYDVRTVKDLTDKDVQVKVGQKYTIAGIEKRIEMISAELARWQKILDEIKG